MSTDTATPALDLKTYHGNCHCGAFKFHIKVPELTSVTQCNCSICSKIGYKWIFPAADSLVVEKGEGTLKNYQFGPHTMDHLFCGKCGTGVMSIGKGGGAGINARSLMDVDVLSLKVNPYDGKSADPKYVAPKFTGKLPIPGEPIPNAKLYTGSCHCGAITVAYLAKGPLTDNPHDDGFQECDCSICVRNGTTLVYPGPSQISISDPSGAFTPYHFGRKFVSHDFCGKCGVAVQLRKLDIGEAKWKESHPQHPYEQHFERLPVNLRLFEGVEWDEIKVPKGNWSTVGEKYVCPE